MVGAAATFLHAAWLIVAFVGLLVAAWLLGIRWEPIFAAGLVALVATAVALLFRNQELSDTLSLVAYALLTFGTCLGLIATTTRRRRRSS